MSVVIPVFNGAAYVGTAIESVLGQTHRDLELIVVDDGSTDATGSVVGAYRDERLRYHYQENRGLSGARNTGVRLARGAWVAFLDCDDYWLPTKLERQLARAAGCEAAGLVYCATRVYSPDGTLATEVPARLEGRILPQLLLGNQISGSGSSVMVRRDLLVRYGGFDESLVCSEDWDAWLRLSTVTEVAKVDEYLVCLRDSPNSLGKRVAALRDANLRILERAFGSYAGHLASLRRAALRRVYMTAAVNYQEQSAFAAARRELLRTVRYAPLSLRVYWRLSRALVNRK